VQAITPLLAHGAPLYTLPKLHAASTITGTGLPAARSSALAISAVRDGLPN
jgi:hypothetical protein